MKTAQFVVVIVLNVNVWPSLEGHVEAIGKEIAVEQVMRDTSTTARKPTSLFLHTS